MAADDRVERQQDMMMGRRRFMQATAATAAAAVTAGNAAAEHSGLNYDSDLVPDLWIESDVSIATHDRSHMSSEVEYIPDSGDTAEDAVSLADHGGRLAPRPDEDTVHNPVTLRADKIDAKDFYKFPRGEQYDEDGDGEANTDLDALDATHWTTDVSGTAGSLTVEDVDAPSDGPALHVAASGQASGDVALARFSDFQIADGELRKYLQLGVTVDALPSGSSATIRVEDSTGATVDTVIDPSADGSLDSTIATSTVSGLVYQVQLGELVSSLDTIEAVEIEIADGDVDLTLFALNLERSSRWELGTREYKNSDDEVDTETVVEPSGSFSITSVDTLGDAFADATLRDVTAALRFDTSGVDAEDQVEFEFEDLDHPSYPRQMNMVVNRELPTAYDLDYANTVMRDETVLWPEQYGTLEVTTGETELAGLDDVENLDMVDRTSRFDDRGQKFDLATTVNDGEVQVAYYELRVDETDESDMRASGASGPATSGGGGGFFSSAQGMLAGGLAGIGVFFAMLRSRILG